MELRFKSRDKIATLYVCPSFSERGWFTWWYGNHDRYKHGFVVRAMWFGFVARWGHKPISEFTRAIWLAGDVF